MSSVMVMLPSIAQIFLMDLMCARSALMSGEKLSGSSERPSELLRADGPMKRFFVIVEEGRCGA